MLWQRIVRCTGPLLAPSSPDYDRAIQLAGCHPIFIIRAMVERVLSGKCFFSISVILTLVFVTLSVPAQGADVDRPIHWWIGNALFRATTAETAGDVASWTVGYSGDYRPWLEADRMFRQVGNTTDINLAMSQLTANHGQGARLLATNLENWTTSFTVAEAQAYVDTIDSLEDLTVVQWNSHMTWRSGAIEIIDNHPRLILIEMAYPTASLNLETATLRDFYFQIIRDMQPYTEGRKPAIGLTVYTDHNMTTPVTWETMKTQIDAAKLVGRNVFGSVNHPIGIFIADVTPTEFTVDDVNRYILRDKTLLTNGVFADEWTGWAYEYWFGAAAAAIEAGSGVSGGNSLRIDGHNAAENRHSRAMLTQSVRAAPGAYRFAAKLKADGLVKADPEQSATPQAAITLICQAADKTPLAYFSGGSVTGSTGGWEHETLDFEAPAGTQWIRVDVWTTADHLGTAWFDQLRLDRVPTWAALDNRFANSGFDSGALSPWVNETSWFGQPNPQDTQVSVVSDVVYSGSHALRITTANNSRGAVSQTTDVVAGQSYTVEAWLKSEHGRANLLLEWHRPGNDPFYQAMPTITGVTDWTHVSDTFNTPANATRLRVYLVAERSDGSVWFDEVSVSPLETHAAFEPAPEISVISPPGEAGILRVAWDPETLPPGASLLHIHGAESPQALETALPLVSVAADAGTIDIHSLEIGSNWHFAARALGPDGAATGTGPVVSAQVEDRAAPQGGNLQAEWLQNGEVLIGWTPHILDTDAATLRLLAVTGDGVTELSNTDITGLYDLPRPTFSTAAWHTAATQVPDGTVAIRAEVTDASGNTTPAGSQAESSIAGPYPDQPLPALQVWTAPPTAQVRRDAPPPSDAADSFSLQLLRGQARGFQIMLRNDTPLPGARIRFEPLRRSLDGTEIAPGWLAAHFVNYLGLSRNAGQNTPATRVWDYTDGPFPDELSDDSHRDLAAAEVQPVYIRVTAPVDALPGRYDGRLWIDTPEGNREVEFNIEILPGKLPPTTDFFVGQWFRWDLLASHFGVERKSEAGWRALARLAEMLAAHRHNYVKIDHWDLIRGWVDDDGTVQHDFRELDRFLDTFLAVNPDQIFVLSHFGQRKYSGWHVPLRPVVYTVESLDSMHTVYLDPIDNLLPSLRDHLLERGLLQRTLVHVADEPTHLTYPSYRQLSQRIQAAAPEFRRIDALAIFGDELGADLEVRVPLITRYQQNLDKLDAERAAGAEVWLYTAWSPHGEYLNRMIDEPTIKPRLLKWYCGLTGSQGALHWALNWWDADIYQFNAPGDSYVVYPGGRFIVNSSLRFEAHREGIEDWQLMEMLVQGLTTGELSAEAARAQVAAIAEPSVRAANDYSTDWHLLENAREALLAEYLHTADALTPVEQWYLWALEHFDSTTVDPNADPDRDGRSNWMEFLAGTDPLDPNSLFRSELVLVDGVIRLAFDTLPEREYVLWYSGDLRDWDVIDVISGDGQGPGREIPMPEAQPPVFLKVEIRLPNAD